MAISFMNIHAVRINELLHDLDAQNDELLNDISFEMEAAAINVVRIAKQKTSKELGFLARSITYEKKSTLNFAIIAGAQYAAFAEFGTSGISSSSVVVPAGFESVAQQFIGVKVDTGGLTLAQAIQLWGSRKGMEPADIHGVYLKILHKGRNPHPFLIPAFLDETEKLETRLRTLLRQ
jgi:HK97 gp10 family phage protein